jgi:acetylornithine deacetylase/succinyl-diaminopimelate desuccinylase-like protein
MKAEGVPEKVEAMTAWVDAAFLNEAGVPAVCFGPGSIAKAHAAEEWVPTEELMVGARVLSRFAREFLSTAL